VGDLVGDLMGELKLLSVPSEGEYGTPNVIASSNSVLNGELIAGDRALFMVLGFETRLCFRSSEEDCAFPMIACLGNSSFYWRGGGKQAIICTKPAFPLGA
jgi:hypothetical protein